MDQITKAFLGVILMLLLTFTGASMISASIDASNAEQFVTNIANTVENSNYSEAVMRNLENNIANHTIGSKTYKSLTIIPYDSNEDGVYDSAQIELKYQFAIKILNAGKECSAIAYAK